MSERPGTSDSGLGLIRRGMRRQRRHLLRGYPFMTSWHLCETSVPIVIGFVIDRGVANRDVGSFASSLLVLVAVFVTLALSYRIGSRFIVRAIEDESHRLRTEVAGHVLDPRGVRTDLLSGEVLSLATSDASLVPVVFRQIAFAVAASVSLTAAAVYLIWVDLAVGLVVLIGVPAIVAIIQVASPLVARRTHAQQERTATATGLATDLVQGLRPLKGIGGEDVATARYRGASQDAAGATIGLARSWGYLTGMTTGLSGVLLAVVVLLAGTRALDGDITIGQLIAVVGLAQFLAEPITALGELSAEFARSRASAQRIVDFMRTPALVAAGERHPTGDAPQLSLCGVTAGPIEQLDLFTSDGTLVAVVVEEPTVSDAVVAVVSGELEVEAGTASFGGVELTDLAVPARRGALVVTDHDASVADGTVRSIVDPTGDIDDETLAAVLDASAADDVVALHPDGLDRVVREGATTLSGGQRQRLILARALAADPPVLLLQDPTSAVDAVTEHEVADGLARLRRRPGRATVVITSSPAVLRVADHVVHVRGGSVHATGTHDELLDDPAYREAVLR